VSAHDYTVENGGHVYVAVATDRDGQPVRIKVGITRDVATRIKYLNREGTGHRLSLVASAPGGYGQEQHLINQMGRFKDDCSGHGWHRRTEWFPYSPEAESVAVAALHSGLEAAETYCCPRCDGDRIGRKFRIPRSELERLANAPEPAA
jgi:hypothetical protein